MDHETSRTLTVFLLLTFSSVAVGLYLISDYYMDEGFPSAFGMACEMSIQDDCLYVNSHFRLFGINDYDDDNECTLVLDAGTQVGARYKLDWKRFQVEWSPNCTNDYLAIYDSNLNDIANTIENRYCGKTEPVFNGSQQYITIKFRTDSDEVSEGFRFMATRTLPAPCPEDFFLCESENLCIDSRLKCDGTPQCDDRTDENDCNFWEKVIGGLLALGVGGMIGVLFVIVIGCGSMCVGYCICKKCCCKKRRGKVGVMRDDESLKDEYIHNDQHDRDQSNGQGDKNGKGKKASNKRSDRRIDPTTDTEDPWSGQTDHYINRPLPSPGRSIDRQISVTSLGEQNSPRLTNLDDN